MRGTCRWGVRVTAGVLVLMVCGVAWAQDGGVNRTFGGLAIGAGYDRIDTGGGGVFGGAASTPDDFSTGLAFDFDIGYLAKNDVYLEFMGAWWMGTIEGDLGSEEWSVGTVAGGLRWYPLGEGFYARGGFGAGIVRATLKRAQDGADTEFNEYGLALLGGAGYDVTISDRVAAGPAVDVNFVDVGDGVNVLGVRLLIGLRWR